MESLKVFSDDAYWQNLIPLEDVVPEPENPSFSQPRAPTIEEKDAGFVPVKHNFDETFERPKFEGKVSCTFDNVYYLAIYLLTLLSLFW